MSVVFGVAVAFVGGEGQELAAEGGVLGGCVCEEVGEGGGCAGEVGGGHDWMREVFVVRAGMVWERWERCWKGKREIGDVVRLLGDLD